VNFSGLGGKRGRYARSVQGLVDAMRAVGFSAEEIRAELLKLQARNEVERVKAQLETERKPYGADMSLSEEVETWEFNWAAAPVVKLAVQPAVEPPVRSWLFHFVVSGPGLDAGAMARITDAFLLAVDSEGATAGAGGGLAEIVGEQDHDTPHSN